MKYLIFTLCLMGLMACQSEETKTDVPAQEEAESLITIDGDLFIEYYPGKEQIKMTGRMDEEGERHGVWKYFTEQGRELSVTDYIHGKKNGFSVVYFPNGMPHYRGEYKNDKPVGLWTIYDEQTGKVKTEQEYGYPEEAK